MRRSRNYGRLEPERKDGYLYYVRLKTEYGIFYKLGFTALQSVHERLSYGGSRDADYIDKILLFVRLSDAFDVEGRLHSCLTGKTAFARYSAAKEFPLSNNGQTELYIEDVLSLDPDYTDNQFDETTQRLREKRLLIAGKTVKQGNLEDAFVAVTVRILTLILVPIALPLILLFAWVGGKSVKVELLEFLDRITGSKKENAEKEAKIKNALEKEMRKILYERDRQSKFAASPVRL